MLRVARINARGHKEMFQESFFFGRFTSRGTAHIRIEQQIDSPEELPIYELNDKSTVPRNPPHKFNNKSTVPRNPAHKLNNTSKVPSNPPHKLNNKPTARSMLLSYTPYCNTD